MKIAGRETTLTDLASIAWRDALPVIGVFFLGWEALSVIFLYWLDGLLCLWAMMPAILATVLREEPDLLAKYRGPTRWLMTGVIFSAALLLTAIMMAIPGAFIAAKVAEHYSDPIGTLLASRSTLLSAASMFLLYLGQSLMALFGEDPAGDHLSTQERGNLVLHRAILASFLSSVILGAWTMKIFTLMVAALFAWTELDPGRYLRLVGPSAKGTAA